LRERSIGKTVRIKIYEKNINKINTKKVYD